ncbi:MAG TPA: hypothetical protein VIK18_06460 [Pirellulales bacterium]
MYAWGRKTGRMVRSRYFYAKERVIGKQQNTMEKKLREQAKKRKSNDKRLKRQARKDKPAEPEQADSMPS